MRSIIFIQIVVTVLVGAIISSSDAISKYPYRSRKTKPPPPTPASFHPISVRTPPAPLAPRGQVQILSRGSVRAYFSNVYVVDVIASGDTDPAFFNFVHDAQIAVARAFSTPEADEPSLTSSDVVLLRGTGPLPTNSNLCVTNKVDIPKRNIC